MTIATLTIQEDHLDRIRESTSKEQRGGKPGLLLCGKAQIAVEPWSQQTHEKYLSYLVLSPSRSLEDSLIEALTVAQEKNLTVALIYSGSDEERSNIVQTEVEIRKSLQLAQKHNREETKLLTIFPTSDRRCFALA